MEQGENRLRVISNGHDELCLLTVMQTSIYLDIHEQTVYLMARMGKLPFQRIGRAVRFDKLALDQRIRKKIEENEAKLLPWSDDSCGSIGAPEQGDYP